MPQPNYHLGPYTLLEKLGNGQFGVVWKAQRREGKAPPCAIKLPTDHEIKWADVEKEADVWVRATGHPNIVPLIEANQYDGQIVLVSEYVAGGSLLDWLRTHNGKAPTITRAIEMMSGILVGLEHLHALNIVHRDLKPANVLLQGEIPRLADFGLSRVLSSTQSSVLAGTPAYMSPEALDSDEERTVQTDIWAAGVILYQLLTGRLPFPQRQQGSLMKAIMMNPPAPLPTELPERLRGVVWCALEKDLRKRYKSATQMKQALRDSLTVAPTPPPKPPSPEPPRIKVPLREKPRVPAKPARSRRGLLAALGGVALLVASIGIGLWQRTLTNIASNPTPTATAPASATPRKPNNAVAPSFTEDLGNGVMLEMVQVPGGTFQMGSNNHYADEKPVHEVTVSPFVMGKYEVTQSQWQAVMGTNPSNFKGNNLPVEQVSWETVQEFCRRLNHRTGQAYRLPSEAEWEYACRAGSTGDYAGDLDAMAWYGKNSGGKTHAVGLKRPNTFGLYDMHGNVWEWCEDVWHENYNGAPKDGLAWASGGNLERRVLRGGSWDFVDIDCRSALRNYGVAPGIRNFVIGFRVVVSESTS